MIPVYWHYKWSCDLLNFAKVTWISGFYLLLVDLLSQLPISKLNARVYINYLIYKLKIIMMRNLGAEISKYGSVLC
jgi:hypothetical protein